MTTKAASPDRVWGIQKYAGKRGTTYRLRWRVSGRTFSRSFSSRKQGGPWPTSLQVRGRCSLCGR